MIGIMPKVKRRSLEQIRQDYQLWCQKHPQRLEEREQLWNQAHSRYKEKARQYGRKWRENNPVKIAAKVRWQNFKRELTPEGRIESRLRRRINEALHLKVGFKSARTRQLLGCDLDWLKAWLEVQFQPGMAWHNYGQGWHVDHIRPCASFDLLDLEQQKQCFHWTNLQPLWANDNFSKKNKWISTEQ